MPRMVGRPIHQRDRALLVKGPVKAQSINEPRAGDDGADGSGLGPADALFTISGGGALIRRHTSDGSSFWSAGDNYFDLAVDPTDKWVYAIGTADSSNNVDRVVKYDFSGGEKWNIDLHAALGDASETVDAFTLARDRSALYTVYYDGSNLGVVQIDVADGAVTVIGKDSSGGGDLLNSAAFDSDGDYLYLSDAKFISGNRGRITKFSLGDGSIDWEMSPDLSNQHTCPLLVTDTLIWAQKHNGVVILVDRSNGGILTSVDLNGSDGQVWGELWKDHDNGDSIYVMGVDHTTTDSWLYRVYVVGGVLKKDELKAWSIAMERVVRDRDDNFYIGSGNGDNTNYLVKLNSDLSELWRISGPDPRNFCTEQGRSVFW